MGRHVDKEKEQDTEPGDCMPDMMALSILDSYGYSRCLTRVLYDDAYFSLAMQPDTATSAEYANSGVIWVS